MHGSKVTRGMICFVFLFSALQVMPAEASRETTQGAKSPVSGWAGVAGGPVLGTSTEPFLMRLSLLGGAGIRLAAAPFALDGSLAVSFGGSPEKKVVQHEPGEGVPPFATRTEQIHLEVVPFVRGIFLLGDSFGLYFGVGAGFANIRSYIDLDGGFIPQASMERYQSSILRAQGSDTEAGPTGLALPDGGVENVLMLRLAGGVEYTLQGAFRMFVEPLTIHSYHLEGGARLRFAILGGFASVF